MQIEKKRFRPLYLLLSLPILLISFVWFLLQPVGQGKKINFVIKEGQSSEQIITNLEQKRLIRSSFLFKIYFQLNHGQKVFFHPGEYQLDDGMNYKTLTDRLTKAQAKTYNITFYPGSALNFNNNLTDKTPYHRQVLRQAGFKDGEIDRVFAKPPKHKLFDLIGNSNSLEGLIFGETFNISKQASLERVLKQNFDYYYKVIKDNNLEVAYKKHNLSLYQGIILASIVEKEVHLVADRPIVAQVFLNRLQENMGLGSDVTYQYASRLAGTKNNLNIDSPYNTRQRPGLPPTPIATPSLDSLLAVAKPTANDYLFFLAGDDGQTYYAKTNAEHNANIKHYCQKGCSVY